MIKPGDVITIRIPFPNISSQLAVQSHMYICRKNNHGDIELVKCQTLKPKMLNSRIIQNYVDEDPDIKRNPFKRTTRIDCDKLFKTRSCFYPLSLRTGIRPDVSPEVLESINRKLSQSSPKEISLSEQELIKINPAITLRRS